MTPPPLVWLDFENSPHVPFLLPFIEEFVARGWEIVATARARSQTGPLLDLYGIPHDLDREGTPSTRLGKAFSVVARAHRLRRRMKHRGAALALGHGSRAQVLAAASLGVPAVTFFDYEHVSASLFFRFADRLFVPRAIASTLGDSPLLDPFDGVKEELYLHHDPPATRGSDPWADLGIPESAIRVVARGPATRAHYLHHKSGGLFGHALERILAEPTSEIILFERYSGERTGPDSDRLHRPPRVFDVRPLLRGADLVIGGGGTMVREAAVLGVPAVSLFQGTPGAVDALLARRGQLIQIHDEKELGRIVPRRRSRRGIDPPGRELFETVFEQVVRCARTKTNEESP